MLDLSYNPILHIEEGAFANLRNLVYLFFVEVYLPSIEPDIISNLSSLTTVSASDNRLCCLLSDQENVTCARTSPKSPLETCGRLYPSVVLGAFGWIIGFTALVGNINVLVLRLRQDRNINVQTLLIINLAVADCLMGVYMIFITSADIHFGETFFLSAPWWRDSILCKVASVLAFISSELSVLTLTLITLERLICILFPFGKYRFDLKVTRVLLVALWIIVFMVGLVPFLLDSHLSGIYGLSDVCLGLPLHVDSGETGILRFERELPWSEEFVVVYDVISSDSRPSWIYSVVIFIGLNMVLFIVILVCYISMFIAVQRSARSVGNSKMRGRDITVARKMAFIVLTNFACWMPIIIMGILTQTGLVVLPSSLYAWTVIFILPINSSINPLLYTFLNSQVRRRKRKGGMSLLPSISRNIDVKGVNVSHIHTDNSTGETRA
ncbi:G-protein coupled receptor GRL101-like [Strongylocentrotus purpuratus]|uniref:G-protein coupled receptors family 1 profile domain-containing protein n=1 Tax=Strongylocentrotus purpuratus TaxID=7668 RepID=A0A7M7P6K3_STRPU|nr:G-protein coupled receptor GRL101-like [Strongylocentrotus purpuratus]